MNSKVQMIVSFLETNLHRRLSSNEMAGSIDLSRTHVCRLFKAETGVSPGQYLQQIRMQKAARLLATTGMSVKQIAGEVGYSDKALFARHFKKTHGITPSAYRTHKFFPETVRED
jgi:AraC family transcriptional regulator, arabinose operon regulatory protein